MTRLSYLTEETVEKLRADVAKHLDWYYSPDTSFHWEPPATAIRDARIDIEPLDERLVRGSDSDAENALLVYGALPDITPHQASDERFWVHLAHFECPGYISDRWLAKRPKDPSQAERRVQNHFFARDARVLIRDCGISRLWWLGHIAHKAYEDDPGLFLKIVLHRQDVRSNLIERPSVSLNPAVLHEIFEVMRRHWVDGSKQQQAPLFKREVFRSWMMGLNRRGGVVLMDALPSVELRKILRDEADRALEANANGA